MNMKRWERSETISRSSKRSAVHCLAGTDDVYGKTLIENCSRSCAGKGNIVHVRCEALHVGTDGGCMEKCVI